MFRRIALIAVLLLPMCLGLTARGVAQDATPATGGPVTILAPEESYEGRSRGELQAQQWQWIISFPVESNPGLDPTGEMCGFGQSGSVFFLPGNFSGEPTEVTCVVPQGMAIFVSLGGAGCTTVEPPPFFGRDEAELTECAIAATDALVEVNVSINGEEVPDVVSYRSVSPMFTLTFPENNLFDVPAGVANSVSDGYSIIIAPPAPGEYEITVINRFEDPPQTFEGTIRVIVVEPQIIEPEASPAASPMASPET